MNYDGDIIRPPSEANSIILQVTVGCSHNRCTFCGAYKEKKFRIRSQEEVLDNIAFAARYCGKQKRVFLADGDVLILSQKRLVALFELIRENLPQVNRIALYGNAKAIRAKTVDELKELKRLGLHRIYMGLESGANEVLAAVKKDETDKSMALAACRAKKAGVFLSVTVLLGLGGVQNSLHHARETARVLSLMEPKQIAALCLMPLSNTDLGRQYQEGTFELPDSTGILLELQELLLNITCYPVQFMANHASNYLPLSGRLPRDREAMLNSVKMALLGNQPLVPERFRAL
ncbi:Fe-S oxidoreductase [Desulfocapsa sulfexigens DSM 10523]|uniref:Fe-S oxidoreductase n=1 Tax=Desulfocapsa sulfexigens (strain DSM 10523 / SB164P1) TaxID=1167006 RepID=M1PSX8_DESSD|nr:radical SAM protein [Desulfocapsa sulfexigens]AGF79421.1 Fe-S oxidoreductase [Desulfocapsa sulfexigens DSM 10523]